MAKLLFGGESNSTAGDDSGKVTSAIRGIMPSEREPSARAAGGGIASETPEPAARPALALDEVRGRKKSSERRTEDRSQPKAIALPRAVRTVSFGRTLWFALSFAAPILLGAVYLFFVAPDEYITEYRFSIRAPVGQQAPVNGAASASSFSALFGASSASGNDTLQSYTVVDYLRSGQAARDLDTKLGLRTMFNKPSDPFSKLGNDASAEALAQYWQSMIFSSYDVTTGLAVVRVKAYTASDSYAIANSLLTQSSDLVNSIGTRSQQDSVRFAQQQLDRANAQVAKLTTDLTNLRRRTNVVDPTKTSVAANDALISELLGRRAQADAQLQSMIKQLRNTEAPQVDLMQRQLGAIDQQLRSARASGGGEAGRQNIAVTVGEFETLNNTLNAAQAVRTAAVQALSTVQTSAESQRLYLTTYVSPVQPESPQGPDRWRDLLLITLVAGMVWLVGRLIGNSIMEHA